MEEIVLTFILKVNVSLSLGDIVYYNPINGEEFGDPVMLGNVTAISDDRLSATVNRSLMVAVPGAGDFIWFSKDSQIETSGIIGYEAMTTMVNSSTRKAELFAVSSEVFESSK